MNRLEEILCVKRAEVQRLLPRRKELQRLAEVEGEYRGFRGALSSTRLSNSASEIVELAN